MSDSNKNLVKGRRWGPDTTRDWPTGLQSLWFHRSVQPRQLNQYMDKFLGVVEATTQLENQLYQEHTVRVKQ
jgi:hypothetical protein